MTGNNPNRAGVGESRLYSLTAVLSEMTQGGVAADVSPWPAKARKSHALTSAATRAFAVPRCVTDALPRAKYGTRSAGYGVGEGEDATGNGLVERRRDCYQ
jgi:hypothetical protein